MNPKVFISHAGEDKERFVTNFAKKLRKNGVDAWYSEWEALPGDSLVDKIFNEGIKDSEVMIIILSKNSIEKKWVKEELNAGFVKRVQGKMKLIPVIIDDCVVPEVLKSTVWETIKDISYYDKSLERILQQIFNIRVKPELGNLPEYVEADITTISSFSREDTIILKTICEEALAKGYGTHLNAKEIYVIVNKEYNITQEIFNESINILCDEDVLEPLWTNIGIHSFSITNYGFGLYAEKYIEDFEKSINDIAYFIVNNQNHTLHSSQIAKDIDKNIYLVNHIIHWLSDNNYIQIHPVHNGCIITKVKPQLKRKLGN